jgi:hypothetical protein
MEYNNMEFDYIKESAKTNNVDVDAILGRLSTNGRYLKLLSVLADYLRKPCSTESRKH